jgi:hypothetical protein
MAPLPGAIAPRGCRQRHRRRLRGRTGVVAALLVLSLFAASSSPIDGRDAADADADAAEENESPRTLFERSYFQLPAHLREAARADLGGVEFDGRLYGSDEKKKKEKNGEKKAEASASVAAEKTTSTSSTTTSSTSSTSTPAAAAAATAPAGHVKVMIVQPDAQQMEAIMRGEQVK